ncbi:MAG: hypothetical protein IH917_15445 [Acidobacteria bacterium]|nr:hypothetical protein [Acidobacteriota bacterium]
MKCILCGERKGKRFCPAKNTSICAQCCGEKRVVEIDCPSDCVYLNSGHTYQSIKKYSAQLQQEKDPLRRRKLYETGQHFGRLFGEIERTIIGYAADLRTLTDQHILQAVSLLKETYRTEKKGVIYEHSSANPLVQALLRDLRASLEKIRTQPDRDFPILKTTNLLDCLEVVEQDIGYHLERASERGSYLGFIKKNHPELSSRAASKGSLIQP